MKIIFYCGNSIEEWSPKSEATGIGGSEEATVNMARELAKLGHEVAVYNRCGDADGTYDGVIYENYEYFKGDETCDVLIYWRQPEYVAKYRRANAKRVYLWLHDVVPEYDILPVKLFVDGIFVLSNYHAGLFPHLKEKLIVTQNGINPDHFTKKMGRNPKKVVYGSSYDRGLKELLECWGEVKLAEPEAELVYFYGKGGLEKAGHSEFIEEIEHLSKQDGVTCLDRISHTEVAEQFLTAGVWAYPCWFPEISCITAMKAQAGGAVPVVTPTAALQETVKWGLTTREPRDERGSLPWGSKMKPALMDEFTRLVIQALDPNFQNGFRQQMMDETVKYNAWMVVAKTWETLFKEAL